MEKGFLRAKEISNLLGDISPQAIAKNINKLKLETIALGARRVVIPPKSIRQLLLDRGFKYHKLIVSLMAIKGGVGKTTLSQTISTRASHYGARTLAIDFDLQHNLTKSFLYDEELTKKLMNPKLKVWVDYCKDDSKNIKDSIINVSPYLDILPSNLTNSRLDLELQGGHFNVQHHIKDILEPVMDDYDLIILDTPPAINTLTACSICASDLILIPITPSPFGQQGMDLTINEINRIKKTNKLKNKDYKVIFNQFEAKRSLSNLYAQSISTKLSPINLWNTIIRRDSHYENSLADQFTSSIFEKPNSSAKEDIDKVTRDLIGLTRWSDKD